ncbi:MAG TPA: SDR family oxidoreductase [Thermoanaerobaculia bacterium]
MRVLITGAAGLVGSSLAAAYEGHAVVALRHRDLDITDARAVDDAVGRIRPDVIFNCAVIGVDDCESDPALAERVNVAGPEQLARAAESLGAAIVHFSTNYVFDGRRTDGIAYTAEDEPSAINVYGVTKARGEQAVRNAAARAIIVRTSWVFGPAKDSFLSTVAARLGHGDRVQAITDTFASTTFVGDLTARVLELVERGAYGTHHVANDGVCSYETFAREAARLTGAPEALIDCRTEESLRRLAPRPRWTPMRCTPPLRPWQEALRASLEGEPGER